jgi:hypothetical protein
MTDDSYQPPATSSIGYKILAMASRGNSQHKIAAELEVSRDVVRRVTKDAGITWTRGKNGGPVMPPPVAPPAAPSPVFNEVLGIGGHLRDVPTGDHPEYAQKITAGVGGVGGFATGGPIAVHASGGPGGGAGFFSAGGGGYKQPETTPGDIRRMIAEELAGSDFAGAILREAARLIPQIMLSDYTHPADATEAMTEFVRALAGARDRLAEQSYARGRNNGAGSASKKMQPVLDKLTSERDEALAKLAATQASVPAGMALARAEVSYHRDTLIAVSKFLADRSRSAPQGA